VSHGDLDTEAPEGAPELAGIVVAATVYKLPNDQSRRLGYVRIGGKVPRDPEPVAGRGCKKGKWYRIYPIGYMCSEEATTDMGHPIVRASHLRPRLDKPLPYQYGFVRATAPQYLHIPTKAEQIKSEFGLLEHIDWYHEHKAEIQTVIRGANDVPLDERGVAVPLLSHPAGFVESTTMSRGQLFGASSDDEAAPFWLEGGKRAIPNVSGFDVPQYALFADRVRRHTGLSFVGSFDSQSEDLARRFGITVDLRLIPTTKVKPDTGSPFHGVEISEEMHFPFAFVTKRDTSLYKLIRDQDLTRPAEPAPHRALVPLSGKARIKEGQRFYQTLGNKERWLKDSDIGIVHKPETWPKPAEAGEKWVDISIGQQVLTLYDGKKPRYTTLISSGKVRFGDPKKDLTTPLGDFRLQSKHIAAAMDSEENSSVSGGKKSRAASMDEEGQATVARLKKMSAAGQKMNDMDQRRWLNVQKDRHPEYGVTRRRGSTAFELRDVPWIQYFSAGYALHGAYWHDVFGVPRSHGCVNLAPIDARIVFNWTDPPVPLGWHGINVGDEMGEGTAIHIRP
jgi:lipoprotein-anchoring transpeptidase ErfK/SrfK